MKTILALTLSAAALLLAIPAAHAGGLAVTINSGGYGYAGGYRCAPARIYYRARPAVVYVQPRVVYVQPRRVIYRSAPVFYRSAPVVYRPRLAINAGVSIGTNRHFWRR
jgi:hypothetical protein